MAATRDNGNIHDKLFKEDRIGRSEQSGRYSACRRTTQHRVRTSRLRGKTQIPLSPSNLSYNTWHKNAYRIAVRKAATHGPTQPGR